MIINEKWPNLSRQQLIDNLKLACCKKQYFCYKFNSISYTIS